MTLQKQCHLKFGKEPIQVSYPPGFAGAKSDDSDEEEEFFLSKEPRFLTADEVELAIAFCKKLPYPQELALTGAVLVSGDDHLWDKNHEELDEIEATQGLPSSRAADGSEVELRQRVYQIREALPNHILDGLKVLAPG